MAEQNQGQIKQNLQDTNQWMRILYMFLLSIALYVSTMVAGAVIVIQALFALITGSDNDNLRALGADLTLYINQIYSFLTYNDERKPFPFAAWGEVEEITLDAATADTVVDDAEVIDVEIVEDDKPAK